MIPGTTSTAALARGWRHFGALGATASGIKVSSGGRELLVLDGAPNHRCRDLAIPRSRATKKARAVTVTAPASAYAANETALDLRPSRSPHRQIRWRHSQNLRSPVIFGCRKPSVDGCEPHVRAVEEQLAVAPGAPKWRQWSTYTPYLNSFQL
jgi:hypothetical protein